jgi:hypothetical protein
MKIISRFKDYYDQVAWTYGGGDPKIRYERRNINKPETFEVPDGAKPLLNPLWRSNKFAHMYSRDILVVGTRIYCIFSALYEYPVKYFLPDPTHELIAKNPGVLREWKKKGDKILYNETPYAIELCRRVGQPVFWVRSAWPSEKGFEAGKSIPHLCKIRNFARFYSADQIYQDLAYVIGNLMHNPPDAAPPVQVDENVRLQKKGFDLKTSFRGEQT